MLFLCDPIHGCLLHSADNAYYWNYLQQFFLVLVLNVINNKDTLYENKLRKNNYQFNHFEIISKEILIQRVSKLQLQLN